MLIAMVASTASAQSCEPEDTSLIQTVEALLAAAQWAVQPSKEHPVAQREAARLAELATGEVSDADLEESRVLLERWRTRHGLTRFQEALALEIEQFMWDVGATEWVVEATIDGLWDYAGENDVDEISLLIEISDELQALQVTRAQLGARSARLEGLWDAASRLARGPLGSNEWELAHEIARTVSAMRGSAGFYDDVQGGLMFVNLNDERSKRRRLAAVVLYDFVDRDRWQRYGGVDFFDPYRRFGRARSWPLYDRVVHRAVDHLFSGETVRARDLDSERARIRSLLDRIRPYVMSIVPPVRSPLARPDHRKPASAEH